MQNWISGEAHAESFHYPPRDNAASKVTGWIRGNTKIGPAFKVAVSQGRHGI